MKNVIIIGSGPAGVTAGIYLTRAGIENVIISNKKGSLCKADIIENYYGFEKPISGEELHDRGVNQYLNLGGRIIEDEIVSLSFEDKLKVIGVKESYKADYIVIATGSSRLLPNINGLVDGPGVSYCAICDAFFYRNKDVVVLGNGNYAKHEAEILLKTAASVTILTNGRTTEIDVINKNTKKIEKVVKNNIFEIHFEDGSYIHCDGIFIAEGIAGATALAKKIGARIEGNKIVVNENMKTNIPGIYAIGDCNGGLLQISKAVYDGTVAAMNIMKEIKK